MKNTSISIIQAIIVVIITLLNASFQLYSLVQLNKVHGLNSEVQEAKHLLLNVIITQYIIAIFMALVAFLVFAYRHKLGSNTKFVNLIVYLGLIFATITMFSGGVIGAIVASKLQCLKADPHVENAWRYTSVSAITGIVGTILVLLVQGFIRRDQMNLQVFQKQPKQDDKLAKIRELAKKRDERQYRDGFELRDVPEELRRLRERQQVRQPQVRQQLPYRRPRPMNRNPLNPFPIQQPEIRHPLMSS